MNFKGKAPTGRYHQPGAQRPENMAFSEEF